MTWSYNAGKRGRNWVRAYWDPARTAYFLEWREEGRRIRQKLSVTTKEGAERKADALAGKFAEMPAETAPKSPELTLDQLITIYLREVNAHKKARVRGYGLRAARVWRAYLGALVHRHPESLDRRIWDDFWRARAEGSIPGWPYRCDQEQIRKDLGWLSMVLNWSTGVKDADGRPYLVSSPWSGSLRKAQKWGMPYKESPTRREMPEDVRQLLHRHAPSWQFKLGLQLERETRHRNASIRRLMWEEVDLIDGTVHWKGEKDKSGRELWVPLTRKAVRLLKEAPSKAAKGPVFPSSKKPEEGTPYNTWQLWLKRAKERVLASIDDESERERMKRRLWRVGFHSEKRAGVRDPKFRKLEPIFQEKISGTNFETLRRIYDDVSTDELRAPVDLL
jgi:hypothetical protein